MYLKTGRKVLRGALQKEREAEKGALRQEENEMAVVPNARCDETAPGGQWHGASEGVNYTWNLTTERFLQWCHVEIPLQHRMEKDGRKFALKAKSEAYGRMGMDCHQNFVRKDG